jgi:hypothetical protein
MEKIIWIDRVKKKKEVIRGVKEEKKIISTIKKEG